MNEHDRQNLEFLLNVGKKELIRWFAQADADDISYALELLAIAQNELLVKTMEVQETVDPEDYTEARAVLSRFVNELK